jgi:hypothetical protein
MNFIKEDTLQNHRCENLKSYNEFYHLSYQRWCFQGKEVSNHIIFHDEDDGLTKIYISHIWKILSFSLFFLFQDKS